MKNPRNIALSTSRSGITLFKWGALLLFTIAFWLRVSPAFAVDEVEFFCNGSSGATCDVFQVDGGNTSTGAADTCVRGEFRCPTTAEEENPVWPADWDALLFPSNLLPSPIPPTEGSPPGAWSFATPWGGSGSFGGIITSTLVSTGTSTILKQGTKNTDDLSKWVVATQSSPPKDAYLAAALASYSSPGGAGTLPGDLLLYFASTRFSPNGSATVGIWFFQENVFVCPSGTAMCTEDSSGNIVPANHTNGDLFLFLTYSGGGEASIQAAKWIGNGISGSLGPATNLVTCPTPNDQACAVTNQLSSITLGKSSTASQALGEGFNVSGPGFAGFPGGVVPTLQFQEGGVDVNSIFGGPAPCFSSVLFASISSGSSPNTAAMKSILLGSFNTCAISATKSCGNTQLNTSTGTITYTISGDVTDTGGGAMENLSIADTFNGSPQTISSLACSCSSDCSFDGPPGCTTAVVQPGGTVHYSAMFTTAANGGMDTVTATMAGVGGGFATATSNTASCPSVGQPRLTTTATASGPSISDTGHLTGATAAAGGTITFHLFSDAACMTEVKTGLSPVSVNGNGNYNSGSFTPTAAGTYYWTASYSGDTNNFPVLTKCGEAGESVNAPSISTRLSANAIAVGQSVTDSATLHNATSDAGGTVTYSVFNNNTCTGTPVANGGTVTVTGGVVPNSNSVTFNSAGTFYRLSGPYQRPALERHVQRELGAQGVQYLRERFEPADRGLLQRRACDGAGDQAEHRKDGERNDGGRHVSRESAPFEPGQRLSCTGRLDRHRSRRCGRHRSGRSRHCPWDHGERWRPADVPGALRHRHHRQSQSHQPVGRLAARHPGHSGCLPAGRSLWDVEERDQVCRQDQDTIPGDDNGR